jgi:hypothetical protein
MGEGMSVSSGVNKGLEGCAGGLTGVDPGVTVCGSRPPGTNGVDSPGWQAAAPTIKNT